MSDKTSVNINAGTSEQVAKEIADRLIVEITCDSGGMRAEYRDGKAYAAAYLDLYGQCLHTVKNGCRMDANNKFVPRKLIV